MPPARPPPPPPGQSSRPPPPPGSRPAPPPPPPSSDFLINSTISEDWSLKPMENSLQPFVPNEQNFSQPTQIFKINTRTHGGGRSRRRNSRGNSSSRSDSTDGSASITSRPTHNTGSRVNAKRRLRIELEDEARLGSAPQLDIDSNTQSLDANASEGPTSDLSKAKHMASHHIFTWPDSSAMRM
jgi:hypothetical protein